MLFFKNILSKINSNNKDIGNDKNNKIIDKKKIKSKYMKIYMNEKAKEDSKNDKYIKCINEKENTLRDIMKFKDYYKNCENCNNIYENKIQIMNKNLQIQQEFIDKNEYGLLPKEALKYKICNIPAFKGKNADVSIFLINYQKNFFSNYQNFEPNYFIPCIEHQNIMIQLQILNEKLQDLNILINK